MERENLATIITDILCSEPQRTLQTTRQITDSRNMICDTDVRSLVIGGAAQTSFS